jgi:hypothetical protein
MAFWRVKKIGHIDICETHKFCIVWSVLSKLICHRVNIESQISIAGHILSYLIKSDDIAMVVQLVIFFHLSTLHIVS